MLLPGIRGSKCVLWLVLTILPTGSVASAQTSRVEQIAAAQAEKNKRLAPEEAGRGEKFVEAARGREGWRLVFAGGPPF